MDLPIPAPTPTALAGARLSIGGKLYPKTPMTRYVAFLRGVSPLNAKMTDLKRCFQSAGLTEVKSVLGSGNLVFSSRISSSSVLQQKAEASMLNGVGRSFYTIVRSVEALRAMLDDNPFAEFDLPADAKRVVTFLREPIIRTLSFPVVLEGAQILAASQTEVFTAYRPQPGNPVFMKLIEQTLGKDATTRTWETIRKCTNA